MATMTSRVGEVIQAIYARVQARPALAGVRVFQFVQPPSVLQEIDSYITISTRIYGEQRFPFASKRIKRDGFSVEGEIICLEPGAGDGPAAIAMQRAETYLAEIEDELRTDPSLGLADRTVAQLTDYEHLYSGNDRGRIHGLRFTIEVEADMVSS